MAALLARIVARIVAVIVAVIVARTVVVIVAALLARIVARTVAGIVVVIVAVLVVLLVMIVAVLLVMIVAVLLVMIVALLLVVLVALLVAVIVAMLMTGLVAVILVVIVAMLLVVIVAMLGAMLVAGLVNSPNVMRRLVAPLRRDVLNLAALAKKHHQALRQVRKKEVRRHDRRGQADPARDGQRGEVAIDRVCAFFPATTRARSLAEAPRPLQCWRESQHAARALIYGHECWMLRLLFVTILGGKEWA